LSKQTIKWGAASAGIAVVPVDLAEIYRAHAFEKHFRDFVRKSTSEAEKGKPAMSSTVRVTPKIK
jgi:hypothetical protein